MSILKKLIKESLRDLNAANYNPLKIIEYRNKAYSDDKYIIDNSEDVNDEFAISNITYKLNETFNFLRQKLQRDLRLEIIAVDPNVESTGEYTDLYTLGRYFLSNPLAMYAYFYKPIGETEAQNKKLVIDLFIKYRESGKLDLIPTIREVIRMNKEYQVANSDKNKNLKTLQQHQQEIVNATKPKRGRPKKNPETIKKTFDSGLTIK